MLQKLNLPSLQSEAIKLIGDTFNVTYSFASARLEMFRRKSFAFALYENALKQIN